jgi:tetratricopeptide (TPR) repeat protein
MPDLKTLYAEGEKLKDDGNFAAAAEKFQEVLAEKPDHVLAHLALAVTYAILNFIGVVAIAKFLDPSPRHRRRDLP